MPSAVATRPHPQWLYEGLISGTLPWHQAQPLTYAQFSERYTLHDSLWVGLFPDVAHPGHTVLGLNWDTLWLPEAIATQLYSHVSLYLLIKVTGTLGLTFANGQSPHSPDLTALERQRSRASDLTRKIKRTELVELEDNRVLLITDTEDRSVTLVFEGTLSFLGMDAQQRLIRL